MSREIIRYKPVDEPVIPGSMMKPEKGLEPLGLFISTYGCQMNDNDSERMVSLLEFMNYTQVPSPEQASLIIINSCSVREKPVHKVQSEVGRYRKLKDKNPNLKIGVAGCVAQQEKDKLLKDLPLLDFVMGPDNIDSLPKIVSDLDKAGDEYNRINAAKFKHQEPYHVETLVRNAGVSTFVNITKGCDNFCTFCVVPYTRGRERSRPYTHLVDDINKLVKKGVKEVTLLGQNVNSYKCESGVNFANLLKGLYKDTDIKRIRYTTSHPKDFSDELVEISRDLKDKICEYIHLPVQSGSSEVLERMNRGYDREHYLKIVDKIKKEIPAVSLSTDIIVGFPGETDEQFEETLSLLEAVKFEAVYAFKYSPRPFTKAARFEDQVPEDVQKERLDRLFKLQARITEEVSERYTDQVVEVLVEGQDLETGIYKGRNEQNRMVYFKALDSLTEMDLTGKILPIKVTEVMRSTLKGEMMSGDVN
ncbi:MAG: tRNA (N6-isopentenyl adenosine(37)-C2)-methylthiotransferase MiaB [Bdellovibrionales bacterium]